MRKSIHTNFLTGCIALILSLSSCVGDLDLKPIDDNVIQPDDFAKHPEYYEQFLAKLYAGLAVSGQEGPAGRPDIEGFDEGMAQYLRSYWNLQELPTDEALLGWNDAGVPELSTINWSSSNGFIYVMYSRIYFQISQCNEFLRITTSDRIAANNIPSEIAELIPNYRAEARMLRALSYWHAIDMFGSVPFVTEDNAIMETPDQKSRDEIFQFILDELEDIEESIPLNPVYGKVGKGALWMLRAKLYLNAEVYTGTPMYSQCAETCSQIISQYGTSNTHGLADEYKFLFCADNDRYARGGSRGEILMVVPYDKDYTRTYGGTLYLTTGAYGGNIDASNYGLNGAWAGPRATSQLARIFEQGDKRAAFFTEGTSIENTDLSNYQDGYSVVKYTNLLSTDWENAGGRKEAYPDTDYPVFRLADTYLMYAECAYRGAADRELARIYMNYLRQRAGVEQYEAITDITLDEILNERMRELYWEGHRRTDLIRFEKFTSSDYLWAWKGGVQTGKSIDTKYRLYPIPAKEIAANPSIEQNFGYK